MSDFRADLHCHSHYSDGADSPVELLQKAIQIGLSGLSITDHDTLEAYPEAMEYAKQKQFPLLSGVELSASHKNEPVHVLGYGFPINSKRILDFCERHQQRRKERNLRILEKLKKKGILVTEEEIAQIALEGQLEQQKKRTIGRPHIAMVLIQKGIVRSIKEAFQKYLGEGKAAYDPGERISVEETITCIREAGGKAILAHPHLIIKRSTVRELLEMPFDGLEGYYAKLSHDQEKEWIKHAEKKGWIITGGSDYHGAVKLLNPLGCSWVGESTFKQLYDHFQAQSQ